MAIGVGGEPRYHVATGDAGSPGSDAQPAEAGAGQAASADARVLRKSLALLEPQSERFMAHFYATLFVRNPELRPMFPLTLGESRKQVFGALARCAWSLDQPELTRWLGELGRDHRKYGVTEQHYPLFCDALLATVRAFAREPGQSRSRRRGNGPWPRSPPR